MGNEDFRLDKWQQRVLEHEGNVCIRAGRQVGKSTIISIKAANYVKEHENSTVLIIAAAQRQAGWLFEKTRAECEMLIGKDNFNFREKPTLTKMTFTNGSMIMCLPAGRTGHLIRGLTVDLLIADEAAYISESVWTAITPMLAVSRKMRGEGHMILISTPFGKGGFYYHCFTDSAFMQFHLSSEDCPRMDSKFLQKEKDRMTKAEYAQEYLGEFIDEWNQFFPTDLIVRRMTFYGWQYKDSYVPQASYYMGVDIARYGEDENAFVIAEMKQGMNLRIVKAKTTKRVSLTDTVGRILELDSQYHFKRIFVDDAGVGGGVLDMLLEKVGRRVVGLNNARRSVDKDDRKKGILKEDMYSNALMLMEASRVDIVEDPYLKKSLKSMQYEYASDRHVKIYGRDSHLAEAFVRACWCTRHKGLRVYIA